MRRQVSLTSLIMTAVMATAGCGRDPFETPPNLIANPNTSGGAGAQVVFLVFPSTPDTQPEFSTWMQAAEAEATLQKAIFRTSGPPAGSPPSEQAEAIRMAIQGGATALVVVPYDPQAIAPVLAEVRAKGISVVTLGATAVSNPPLPGTAVLPEPFAGSASKLVVAVVEDAKKRGFPADPPAALLLDKAGDRFSAERVTALTAAARGAGLTHLDQVPYEFDGKTEGRTTAFLALDAWLKAHPDTAIVLADGDEALAAANHFRMTSKSEKPILVAGYMGFRGQTNPNTLRGTSAFVEGRLDGLVRLAIRTALSMKRGEAPGSAVVMPTPFNRAIGDAARDDGKTQDKANSIQSAPSDKISIPVDSPQ